MGSLETQINTSQVREQDFIYLRSKLTDMEDRSRRDNIRILGIPENEEGSDMQTFLTSTLPKMIPLDFDPPLEFQRAHRIGPKRSDNSSRPRPIIACLLRHNQTRQILQVARNHGPFRIDQHEIRITADYSKETNERRKAFLALRPRLRKLEMKYGLFDPARMWVTKNGVSKDFYNPDELRLFLDSFQSQPMDSYNTDSEHDIAGGSDRAETPHLGIEQVKTALHDTGASHRVLAAVTASDGHQGRSPGSEVLHLSQVIGAEQPLEQRPETLQGPEQRKLDLRDFRRDTDAPRHLRQSFYQPQPEGTELLSTTADRAAPGQKGQSFYQPQATEPLPTRRDRELAARRDRRRGKQKGIVSLVCAPYGSALSDITSKMPGIFLSKGSSRCKQSLQGWILMVCLGVCIHWAWAQGAGAEVIDAAVGRSATIPAPVTADIFSFAWYRGTPYTGRESGRPDGSLQITDLRTNYTGNYTVNAIVSGASLVTATRQLRVYGVDYPPPATPCSCPGSCWQTTLGVACGVLLAAAVIIAGMAVHYERCLTRKGTNTDESAFQKHNTLQNLDTQYENMRTGQLGQSTVSSMQSALKRERE
ncbi:hypothetical protein NDU88_011527 [Pleurodeles waltl]|uniref:Immunoglobulin domain-containing protein n=1 Tax=Pleurodeles waltl TaxID=8319 RepID=A0AAV7PYZ6_PLEWA|nr:hypothetical protein NDU88_011527 [Pleurodeles waltl]